MPDTFDPYHAWLGISAEEQPPNHYRLLGIQPFEGDHQTIEAAADERTGSLHAYKKGEHARAALKLINEVAVAKVCLLNHRRKAAYDKGLRQRLETEVVETMKANEVERARCQKFLDDLQDKDLLSAGLIESMRDQVARSKRPIPVESVAKRLIKAGHLTPALAKRLLAALAEQAPAAAAAAPQKRPEAEEEDLGLAPLEEDKKKGKAKQKQQASDDLGLAPLDDEPAAKKARKTPKKQARKAAEPQTPSTSAQQAAKGPKPAADTARTPAVGPPSLLDEELPGLADDAAALGPLDGLMADSALESAAVGSPLQTVVPRKKGIWKILFFWRRQRGRKENVWDSSLLLIAGGTLLGLIMLGAALFWAIGRGSGDEALGIANDEYRSGSYTQAISKYNQYLRRFPKHNGTSFARVRLGLCRLRQATPRGTSNWSAALETARDVLANIENENDFDEARAELSAMLGDISHGLAGQARAATDPALVEQAQEGIALLEQHVPKSLRHPERLADIRASLAQTEHEIARGRELKEAIAAIGESLEKGDTAEAYQIRRALLKRHPVVIDDPKLAEAVLAISQAQQAAVETVDKPRQPEMTEPATAIHSATALARTTIKTSDAPGAEGRALFVLAEGAAYGLDAATGSVLWRRFLGFNSSAHGLAFPPTPISPHGDGDVLLVDPVRNELQCLDASTGKLRWRHPLGERFDAHPVVDGDKILVATRGGRLVTIEAASGSSSGFVQLPQPLSVAPAVDSARGLVFQPADHSNLFVISTADGTCRRVVHLGFERGSLTARPAVVGRYLFVVLNDRAKDSTLLVLATENGDDSDLPLFEPLQRIRLKGHVDTPPVVAGQRVLVATDLGAVTVFELGGADPTKPLRAVADSTVAGEENLVRFPLMQGGNFWLADVQLTKYDILAAHKRLVPKWIVDEQCVFTQPPVAIGQTVFSVRRKLGVPGVLVSAIEMEEPNRYWETQLGCPLAGEPIVDAATGQVTAVTSGGALFRFGAAAANSTSVADQPMAALSPAEVRRPINRMIRLGNGLLALSAGADSKQIVVYNPREPARLLQLLLPDPLACHPALFGGGLLAPSKAGQVFLIDPNTGQQPTAPFMPRLQQGVELRWSTPAVFAQKEAVLSDGRSGLYRLGINGTPRPHLAPLGTAELSEPIVSPIAVIGNVAYGVDNAAMVTALRLPELSRGKQWPLAGQAVWGPARVGQHVMLSTDDGQLLCLGADEKLVWRVSFPYGRLAGSPLPTDDGMLLASTAGIIWRVESATGEELGRIDSGRPLGTGPVLRGSKLVIGGHDGTIYEVPQP